jgi:hypothetical protein
LRSLLHAFNLEQLERWPRGSRRWTGIRSSPKKSPCNQGLNSFERRLAG